MRRTLAAPESGVPVGHRTEPFTVGSAPPPKEGDVVTSRPVESKGAKAFVMMPFSSEFDDVYDVIRRAVEEVDAGLDLIRLDEVRAAGRISDDLVRELTTCHLCIADVSGANPNVMWEVGYATALKKPVIALSEGSARLPFDIADVRTVLYDRSSLNKTLHNALTQAVSQTLKRYSVSNTTVSSRPNQPKRRSVAVTGSMECPPDKARARLERVVGPYLGSGTDWYCGSFGVIDEAAVNLLLERGEESVTIVGYSSYDVSGTLLEILGQHTSVAFLDASAEQVPLVPGAPSHRDILLAARCDTVIVAWDGVSNGTRQLINWLAAQSKDHLVCFVPPLWHESAQSLIR